MFGHLIKHSPLYYINLPHLSLSIKKKCHILIQNKRATNKSARYACMMNVHESIRMGGFIIRSMIAVYSYRGDVDSAFKLSAINLPLSFSPRVVEQNLASC